MLQGPWQRWSILDSAVGGAVLVVGTWYMHRGFFLGNFPQIAADLEPGGSGITLRLVILILASIVASTGIAHMFDAAIPLIIGDDSYVLKRFSKTKRIIIYLARIFTFVPEPDPRIGALKRYMNSSRKDWLKLMVRDWAKTNRLEELDSTELVKIHQHVVTRLKAMSDSSRTLVQQTYTDVAFSGSLFIAFVLLLPIQILSYFTEPLPRSITFQLMLTAIIYFSAVLWGFLFRRRLRTFFNQVITIGLHYYDIDSLSRKSESASANSEKGANPTGSEESEHSAQTLSLQDAHPIHSSE